MKNISWLYFFIFYVIQYIFADDDDIYPEKGSMVRGKCIFIVNDSIVFNFHRYTNDSDYDK